jgi:hypothetical protein
MKNFYAQGYERALSHGHLDLESRQNLDYCQGWQDGILELIEEHKEIWLGLHLSLLDCGYSNIKASQTVNVWLGILPPSPPKIILDLGF